jgi:hypothetical protein
MVLLLSDGLKKSFAAGSLNAPVRNTPVRGIKRRAKSSAARMSPARMHGWRRNSNDRSRAAQIFIWMCRGFWHKRKASRAAKQLAEGNSEPSTRFLRLLYWSTAKSILISSAQLGIGSDIGAASK